MLHMSDDTLMFYWLILNFVLLIYYGSFSTLLCTQMLLKFKNQVGGLGLEWLSLCLLKLLSLILLLT